MSFRTSLLIGVCVVSGSFSLGTARANVSSITVNNPNFDILPAGGLPIAYFGDFFSEAAIPGWTNLQTPGVSGQDLPVQGGVEYNSLPNGNTVFGYTNGAVISQTVAPTVQVGDVYTLYVFLGQRKDITVFGTADLLVNGIKYQATGAAAPAGGWALWTGSYTGLAADAGDSITIELRAAPGYQGDFDNISLTDTSSDVAPTPEPGYLGVLAAGMAGMLWLARLRRAKQ